ncbi:MAG: hypothetical protein R3B09_26480 [Nannocystaceae bacterium]
MLRNPRRSPLAAAVCVVCVVMSALPAAPVQAAASADPASIDEARRLYNDGKVRFDTADYDGAIELWTRAYGVLGEGPETQEIRAALIFNLASARFQAYEVEHNVAQLRKARKLLENYLKALPESADRGETEAWLGKIDEAIARHEADKEPETPSSPPPTTAPAEAPPKKTREKKPGLGLLAGGGVVTAAGLGLLGGMAAGLSRGQKLEDYGAAKASEMGTNAGDLSSLVDDGEAANRMAIALGVAGGVTTAVGVALLALGARKRKSASSVALAPALTVGGAGLAVGGRF